MCSSSLLLFMLLLDRKLLRLNFREVVKFSHSLSLCSFSELLLKSPNKMISFPSLETLSIKLSNLSTISTFEFGGRYIVPTKKV